MKRFIGIILFTTLFSFTYQENDIPQKVKDLVENNVISQLKAMHDPANVKMFSRAYVGSVWKYDLVKKPSGKDKFYVCDLKEYRGAFIIDQYKMRIYEQDNKVLVEDWTTNKFINSTEWLTVYSKAKNK